MLATLLRLWCSLRQKSASGQFFDTFHSWVVIKVYKTRSCWFKKTPVFCVLTTAGPPSQKRWFILIIDTVLVRRSTLILDFFVVMSSSGMRDGWWWFVWWKKGYVLLLYILLTFWNFSSFFYQINFVISIKSWLDSCCDKDDHDFRRKIDFSKLWIGF